MRIWWRETENKPTLMDLFAAYRVCKKLLAMDFILHRQLQNLNPDYRDAMDPDLIRAEKVFSAMPKRRRSWAYFPEDVERVKYVNWMDDAVKRHLCRLGQDILRVQYLGDHEPFDDILTRATLRAIGWEITVSDYDREKAITFEQLMRRFHVEETGLS